MKQKKKPLHEEMSGHSAHLDSNCEILPLATYVAMHININIKREQSKKLSLHYYPSIYLGKYQNDLCKVLTTLQNS